MDYTKELAELKARHARELKDLETRRRRKEAVVTLQVKNVKKLASKIVTTLLIDGLGDSTWKDNNGFAYNALLEYRDDMEASVEKILNKERK